MDDAKQNSPDDSFVFGKVLLGHSKYCVYEVIHLVLTMA